jgi:hypothetical protein
VLFAIGPWLSDLDGRAAEPRPGDELGRRGAEEHRGGERKDPDRRDGDASARRDRRDIEGGGGGGASAGKVQAPQTMLKLAWREGGCSIDGHVKFVDALLATHNASDAMSLEIWGDTHEYVPYQKVYYYMRVPRAAYVTLLWIGPRHDIFVPFQNLHIPADRDVSVDPESIVVPPLGREQWVALASLEPMPLPCYVSEREHLSWLERIKTLPHGVGRWEVRSKESWRQAPP